jgi:hypothetical protein
MIAAFSAIAQYNMGFEAVTTFPVNLNELRVAPIQSGVYL